VVKKSSTAQKFTEGLQLSTFLSVNQVKVLWGQSSLGFVGGKLPYGLVFIMPYTITEVYAWPSGTLSESMNVLRHSWGIPLYLCSLNGEVLQNALQNKLGNIHITILTHFFYVFYLWMITFSILLQMDKTDCLNRSIDKHILKLAFNFSVAVSSGLKLHETFQFETWVICVCVCVLSCVCCQKTVIYYWIRICIVEMYALYNSSGAFQSL